MLQVCCRYSYSDIAYSIAKGLDFEWCKNPDKGLPKPDLVIYLNIDSDTASNRSEYGEKKNFKKEYLIVSMVYFLCMIVKLLMQMDLLMIFIMNVVNYLKKH